MMAPTADERLGSTNRCVLEFPVVAEIERVLLQAVPPTDVVDEQRVEEPWVCGAWSQVVDAVVEGRRRLVAVQRRRQRDGEGAVRAVARDDRAVPASRYAVADEIRIRSDDDVVCAGLRDV